MASTGSGVAKIRFSLTGTSPILFHNVQLASPLNPGAKRLKELNSKRSKTDEDRLLIARTEWEYSFYRDSTGPVMPSSNLFKSLIEGARLSKLGKHIERSVSFTGSDFPLLYAGPRDPDGLWGEGIGVSEFVDLRTVTIQRNKIDRCRPIFKKWAVEPEVYVDCSGIEAEEVVRSMESAGRMIGLGDYRMMYGRFDVEAEIL